MIESALIRKKMEKITEFPLLAESKSTGLIILFANKTSGIVVSNDKIHKFGHYADDWIECNDEKYWSILPVGTSITLTVK